jgi:hypothetical protein
MPDEERGRIFSVTEKRMPEVVGDGKHSLEQLVLRDARAVAMAGYYLRANEGRLEDVPEKGERVRLVEIGTHCRGAIFLDGSWVLTPELEEAVDRMSRGYPGFFFGRYDLRAGSVEELQRGRFKVIELNGVTSEATHIYDPRVGLFRAYRVLFEQWRLAFEIGARNRAAGHRPASPLDLLRSLRAFRREVREDVPS